jgi:ParB family chromosome partitioning protein
MSVKNPLSGVKLRRVDEMFTTEEQRQDDAREKVVNIALSEMRAFKGHPFKVSDDDKMAETVQSVKENGVLMPGIVRPCEVGEDGTKYEIVAGHRRHRACTLAGLSEMPVIVRELTDDEAVIFMVDSNLQREELLPSEKAFAYKMKLDAMKRQAGRPPQNNSAQIGRNYFGKESREILAEQTGESRNQISRYIRLTELIPPLLEYADKKIIAFNSAVEVSYLTVKEQEILFEVMERDECAPSMGQASKLRKCSQEGRFNEDTVTLIMNEERPLDRKVVFNNDRLKKYFPEEYTPRQISDTIFKLLDGWARKRERDGRENGVR